MRSGVVVVIALAAMAMVPPSGSVARVGRSPSGTAASVAGKPIGLKPYYTPGSGNWSCTDPSGSSEISGGANTYIVGNCANGWHVHETGFTTTTAFPTFVSGEIFGDFADCGWVKAANLTWAGNGVWSNCTGSKPRDPATYIARAGSATNCETAACTTQDGSFVPSTGAACAFYANLHPWSASASPIDYIKTLPVGYGLLFWRYETANAGFVLVHDHGHGPNEPTWGFVPRACLPTSLPEGN